MLKLRHLYPIHTGTPCRTPPSALAQTWSHCISPSVHILSRAPGQICLDETPCPISTIPCSNSNFATLSNKQGLCFLTILGHPVLLHRFQFQLYNLSHPVAFDTRDHFYTFLQSHPVHIIFSVHIIINPNSHGDHPKIITLVKRGWGSSIFFYPFL